MKMIESERCLANHLAGVGCWKRSDAGNQLGQIDAIDILHHQIGNALLRPRCFQTGHIWVMQAGHQADFTREPFLGLLVGSIIGSDHLKRNGLAKPHVDRAINLAHASSTQKLHQRKLAKALRLLRRIRLVIMPLRDLWIALAVS
jgi:hypothetical protein